MLLFLSENSALNVYNAKTNSQRVLVQDVFMPDKHRSKFKGVDYA